MAGSFPSRTPHRSSRAQVPAITAAGYDVTTPVVVCNSDEFNNVNTHTGPVTNGDLVIELEK